MTRRRPFDRVFLSATLGGCLLVVISSLCMGLGGWQYQQFQHDQAYEEGFEWCVCNSTNWYFLDTWDAIVDIQTDKCQWLHVPLFECHDSDDPNRCLRDATNAFLQPAWNCVCAKHQCDPAKPPQTTWPNTHYHFTQTRAIILLSFGGVAFIMSALGLCACCCCLWIDVSHR